MLDFIYCMLGSLDTFVCRSQYARSLEHPGALLAKINEAGNVCGGLEDTLGAVKGFLRAQ